MKELLNDNELLQWIDGSFVTMKPEPDDIDLVTFIDNAQLEAIGSRIAPFKYPASVELFGVDAYIVRVYNKDEKNYPLYLGDQKYWMEAFNKTRRTRYGQRLQKGFLEINH